MSTHVRALRADDGESHDEYMRTDLGLLGHTKFCEKNICFKPVVNDAESLSGLFNIKTI